jgi:hypothetical protein
VPCTLYSGQDASDPAAALQPFAVLAVACPPRSPRPSNSIDQHGIHTNTHINTLARACLCCVLPPVMMRLFAARRAALTTVNETFCRRRRRAAGACRATMRYVQPTPLVAPVFMVSSLALASFVPHCPFRVPAFVPACRTPCISLQADPPSWLACNAAGFLYNAPCSPAALLQQPTGTCLVPWCAFCLSNCRQGCPPG